MVVKRPHGGHKKWQNWVGDILRLPNLGIEKKRKGRKHLLVVLWVANVQLIQEGFVELVKRMYVEWIWLIVVFDERVCGPNHEKDIFLIRYAEAEFIKMRDNKSLCRWSVRAQLLMKRDNFSVVHHPLANSNVAYIRRPKDNSQEIGGHCVFRGAW